MPDRPETCLRPATTADARAITAIARATGQHEDWEIAYPSYLAHLMGHGLFLVAEREGAVAGFGATLRIGPGQRSISMLTDLFVDPAMHGTGTGRAILAGLWRDEPRRMTFSSLHSNAVPLYTSFGTSAWWPLLYLSGSVSRLAMPRGWTVSAADAEHVGALERDWTGFDRTAEHRMWAAWPGAHGVVASLEGQPVAAGTAGDDGADLGISHLALDPAITAQRAASDAVLAVLCSLDLRLGRTRVCLPGLHPAVRPLLAAGWRIEEFDLHMASEPGLIDPLRSVPSPAVA